MVLGVLVTVPGLLVCAVVVLLQPARASKAAAPVAARVHRFMIFVLSVVSHASMAITVCRMLAQLQGVICSPLTWLRYGRCHGPLGARLAERVLPKG